MIKVSRAEPFATSIVRINIASRTNAISHIVSSTAKELLESKPKWKSKAYREAYADTAVDQGIAWQVRINRELRGLSQKQLAERLGTRQSAVSRIEDPLYGKHSLPQLKKLAHAFGCALIVKLAPYSTLVRESASLTEKHLYAPSFDEEMSE